MLENNLKTKDYTVGYCKPPNRFSSTNQPKNKTHRGPSVVTELKKILEKKIDYEDPTLKKHIKGKIKTALALRYVYNGLEGETNAIEGIIDRMDGKINGGNKNIAIAEIVIKIEGADGDKIQTAHQSVASFQR